MEPLFCREVGDGPPLVVLHGGPDFDHTYLLPELDRLAASFRLLYYDQRGRGRSAGGVRAEDVTLASELDDLDRVRDGFGLESTALLGHSWGGVLALAYAIRHPERVSRLVLLDSAPASAEGFRRFRAALRRSRPAGDLEQLEAIVASEAWRRGDLAAEAAAYRIHFRPTIRHPEQLEALVARLREHFTEAGVLLARAIEERLYAETAAAGDWTLFPALRQLAVPTLVLHGEHDFIPLEQAARIADAVPGGELTVLPDCGHFTYLEAPERVHEEVARFGGAA